MYIKIDEGAEYIIKTIEENGFEAFAVGGCVRDSIMGRIPNDWDITTSAKAHDIINMFEKTIPTGIKHGTVTILVNSKTYEVTTYRIDGEYIDMRRPENVVFSESLEDDLSRRDFTINAMAYNYSRGLVDEFNGIQDISNKTISCVGEPDKRFNEDALRILRAVRFSAKLGFEIDEKTFISMKNNAENIKKVSFERIRNEVDGILISNPQKLDLLKKINISDWIFNGATVMETNLDIAKNIIDGINDYEELFRDTEHLKNLIISVIFKNLEGGHLERMLKRLRYSNKEIKSSLFIHKVYTGDEFSKISNETIDNHELRILIKRIMRDAKDVELVKNAIYSKFIQKKEKLSLCFCIINDIIKLEECFSISQLKVNGRDIIENGFANGSEIGKMLDVLLDEVIKNPELNEEELLLDFIRKRKFN